MAEDKKTEDKKGTPQNFWAPHAVRIIHQFPPLVQAVLVVGTDVDSMEKHPAGIVVRGKRVGPDPVLIPWTNLASVRFKE